MSGPARKGPLHVGRFERRIVVAISIAAFVPFVVALILGRIAMHELVGLPAGDDVREALETSRDMARDHVAALRGRAELAADVTALDPELG